jgi:hypothetical protein
MGLQTINHTVALEVVRGRTIGGVNRFTNNEEQLKLVRERVLDAVGLDLTSALENYKPSSPKSVELTDDTVL